MKARFKELDIECLPEVTQAFKEARNSALIICPNHAAQEDPYILVGLSRLIKEHFMFLTARDLFGPANSTMSKTLQKLGCFSVVRETADISAFKAALKLLKKKKRLVIFPEGEVSHQNDFLLQLENGAEHIALAAQENSNQIDSNATVLILPLILKYRFKTDIVQELRSVLGEVELKLGYTHPIERSMKLRIMQAYHYMLDTMENEHGYKLSSGLGLSLEARLKLLCEQLITESSKFLNIELEKNLTPLAQIHLLKNAFNEIRWHKTSLHSSETNDFETSRIYFRHLKLATDLAAISAHGFNHNLSQEAAAELVCILEHEVCGTNTIKRPEIVTITAGKTIDVSKFLEQYKNNRKQTIDLINQALRSELSKKLVELNGCYKTIFVN
jgi:hypothetical protein